MRVFRDKQSVTPNPVCSAGSVHRRGDDLIKSRHDFATVKSARGCCPLFRAMRGVKVIRYAASFYLRILRLHAAALQQSEARIKNDSLAFFKSRSQPHTAGVA